MTSVFPAIEPRRAIVVPRGVHAYGGEVLPLETHLRLLMRDSTLIALVGPAGSGKTTALSHVAAVMADVPMTLIDEPADMIALSARPGLCLVTSTEPPRDYMFDAVIHLAPWGESERIDYLLERHPAAVRSVMERLHASPVLADLGGLPRWWTVVLDLLAEHPAIDDLRLALWQAVEALLATFGEGADQTREIMASAARRGTPRPAGVPMFLTHPLLMRLALAESLARSVEQKPASTWWQSRSESTFDLPLVEHTAWRLRLEPGGVERLRTRLVHENKPCQADYEAQSFMTSVMIALDPTFRPPPHVTSLAGVHAHKVDWSDLNLQRPIFASASLVRARLDRIEWADAIMNAADLRRASLVQANLPNARLADALLDEAHLVDAVLHNADLTRASAVAANFNGATMSGVEFRETDLRGASFRGASLHGCFLYDANVAAADFTGAKLAHAMCLGCDFGQTILDQLTADGATFDSCNFGDMQVDGLSACDAQFKKADLTASRFTNAKLAGASFRGAGLADIGWPGADLRNADFTFAAFHMGSSRSGLVDSPIACEGSRTGFYTQDDLELYKPPEAIRKANLCGANLIGARVTGTDWYLVDLRGAKYTNDQALWFHKCGAILVGRE